MVNNSPSVSVYRICAKFAIYIYTTRERRFAILNCTHIHIRVRSVDYKTVEAQAPNEFPANITEISGRRETHAALSNSARARGIFKMCRCAPTRQVQIALACLSRSAIIETAPDAPRRRRQRRRRRSRSPRARFSLRALVLAGSSSAATCMCV